MPKHLVWPSPKWISFKTLNSIVIQGKIQKKIKLSANDNTKTTISIKHYKQIIVKSIMKIEIQGIVQHNRG